VLARTTHITLLERLSAGNDGAAWGEFMDRYGDLLRGFGLRRGLASMDCDDLVQDVVANLVTSMPAFRYDPARGRFRGYLKTIAVRAILRRSFQKRGQGALETLDAVAVDTAALEETDRQWESEWRQYHLRVAMRTVEVEFGSADRAAFQRYAVDGLGAKETAELVGLSVDQVYQAKSRIMRRLAELIAEQTREEG
jgi:RNA polymerase sigma-70 factor (ECF subfamily)